MHTNQIIAQSMYIWMILFCSPDIVLQEIKIKKRKENVNRAPNLQGFKTCLGSCVLCLALVHAHNRSSEET